MTDRTHGPFRVGDVVEVLSVEKPWNRHLIGAIATVVGFVDWRLLREIYSDLPDVGVRLDLHAGRHEQEASLPIHLRRIDPPSDQYIRQETTDWSKCAWQPHRENA